jgi:anti-anti-sigma regulatory factor
MLKIERVPRPDCVAIRPIGRLEGELLPELKAQIDAEKMRVVVEMDEVTIVDRDVVRFLVQCEARGIELRGCSTYIREWIARESASGK